MRYSPAMTHTVVSPRPEETEEERRRRLAWEAERLAEARASAEAGGLIDEADMDAWIDSLGTSNELPPPGTSS